MSETSYVLHLSETGEGTPIPAALEGLPLEADGVPIFYRMMKIARVGPFTHRGTGEEHTITKERADEWVKNTMALAGAGVEPFIPGQHREKFNAADNYGYIKRVFRDGDDVKALVALYGNDARTIAARNSRSVYVVKDARDSKGNVHKGESIAHVALTPNPALPDLGPTVKIAASADGPAIEAPIFEPSVPKPESVMTPELARKLREKFSIGTDVPDAQLADKAAEKALALSADIETEKGKATAATTQLADLTKERDTLKSDLAAAKVKVTEKENEVLALSADTSKLDPMSLSLISRAYKTEREQVIASGVISEAGMKEIDALLMSDGRPTKAALALSAGSTDPFCFRLCEIIRRNPGIKTSNPVKRPDNWREASRNPAISASAEDEPEQEKADPAQVAQLRKWSHLPEPASK